jgi:predicted lipoprotein with Yx(FWY)xxD motif
MTSRSHHPARARTMPLVTAALALGAASALGTSSLAGAASTNRVVVTTMAEGKSGKVLVAKGLPLYTLANGAPCTGQCLQIWPALTLPAHVKAPAAGGGVARGKLGVTSGPGGTRQVTYNGQPLYWFAQDTAGGGVKGNVTDQWGKWTDVVVGKAAHAGGSSTSNGGSSSSGSGGSNAGSGGVSF